MSKYSKIIFSLVVIACSLFVVYNYTSAQSFGLKTAADTSGLSSNKISQSGDVSDVLGILVSIALSLVGIYFFVLILISGVTWMTAAGSSEKVASAKARMQSAIIGLVIVLSAYALANFVFSKFLQETNATCSITPDGVYSKECKANEVCLSKKCASECDYVYRDYGGKCVDISSKNSCDGKILSGMCPGGSNQGCCVSIREYDRWDKDKMKTGGTDSNNSNNTYIASEENACEAAGNLCVAETLCKGLYNGKSSGESGCAVGNVCCQSCQNIGGKCIDTNTSICSGPNSNLKTGYCHGVFSATNFQCCIGSVEFSENTKDLLSN